MFDDPKPLTSANWENISTWLTYLWIYLPLVITFAFTMLIAHAIIPSLMATGQLPIDPSRSPVKVPFLSTADQVQKLRLLLTGFAMVVLIAAIVLMVLAIDLTLTVREIYDRFLI